MYREDVAKNLSDSDLQELLKYSKKLILKVDETIKLTPLSAPVRDRELVLRKLFMDVRAASYDICVLAESLLNDENHHFSRAMEYSVRLLWECTIDYFYIFESYDSVTARYSAFLDIANSEKEIRKKMEKEFRKKYGKPGRDFWSGKSRKEKIDQGVNKQPNNNISHIDGLNRMFTYLNEQVHGNILMGSYWSFNKHGKSEYRGQIASGLVSVLLFYNVSCSYFQFTGRGFEVKHLDFYDTYIRKVLSRLASESK